MRNKMEGVKFSREMLEKEGWKQINVLIHNLLVFKKDLKLMVWDSKSQQIKSEIDKIEK